MTRDDLLYHFEATVLRWIDGDTVNCRVSLGFGMTVEPQGRFKGGQFRLYGINTPESATRPAGLTDEQWVIEKAAGLAAKVRCEFLAPVGTRIFIRSFKPDVYGRWLALIWVNIADFGDVEKSLNAKLYRDGLAKLYAAEPLPLAP